MSNAEENMSETEDGQTLATTSLSSLTEGLTKLVALNGKALTQGQAVILEASAWHSLERDEQTRRNLRLLISSISGLMPSSLNYQSNLTSILSKLLVQATSTTKSKED